VHSSQAPQVPQCTACPACTACTPCTACSTCSCAMPGAVAPSACSSPAPGDAGVFGSWRHLSGAHPTVHFDPFKGVPHRAFPVQHSQPTVGRMDACTRARARAGSAAIITWSDRLMEWRRIFKERLDIYEHAFVEPPAHEGCTLRGGLGELGRGPPLDACFQS
jgi:hypothetical protein